MKNPLFEGFLPERYDLNLFERILPGECILGLFEGILPERYDLNLFEGILP